MVDDGFDRTSRSRYDFLTVHDPVPVPYPEDWSLSRLLIGIFALILLFWAAGIAIFYVFNN